MKFLLAKKNKNEMQSGTKKFNESLFCKWKLNVVHKGFNKSIKSYKINTFTACDARLMTSDMQN